MNTIKHNINDQVTVELTKEGLKVAEDSYKGNPFRTTPIPGLKGTTYTTELWHLMATFGDKTYMGGPQHFVNNIIEIETPDDVCYPPTVSLAERIKVKLIAEKEKKLKEKEITRQDLAIEICKDEFMRSLHQAMSDAGGNVSDVSEMKVHELRDILAQNGVRFIYAGSNAACSGVDDTEILSKALEKLNNK
jgi:hypothetical protein